MAYRPAAHPYGRSMIAGTALAVGFLLSVVPAAAAPAPGRSGATGGAEPLANGLVGFCGGDDWEPEVAADRAGHVYLVWAHFPGDPTCDPESAAEKRIYIRVSDDGGRTFGPGHVVADVVEGVEYPGQVDCVVTVSDDGTVYVSFLAEGPNDRRLDMVVAHSTDFGRTFTARRVSGHACEQCDHPWTVAHGPNVYTMYTEGPKHILSRSADHGDTWRERLVLEAGIEAFAEGAVVDTEGNAWFAWGDCNGRACSAHEGATYRVSKTLAGTHHTTFTTVARGTPGPSCPVRCGFAFFGPQNDIAIDRAGTLYMAWQTGFDPHASGSPPIVMLSRSTDGGVSWERVGRIDDKDATGCPGGECYALFPRIEGGDAGQIAVMWMDDRLGEPIDHHNGWNVWVRSSRDGGDTWTGPSVRASAYDPERGESRPNGFRHPYGDYQGIDLNRGGDRALMIWGEGVNYWGGPYRPGHVIFRSIRI